MSFTIGTFKCAAEAYELVMAHVQARVNVIKSPVALRAKVLAEMDRIKSIFGL
jgi:hypothetical protein